VGGKGPGSAPVVPGKSLRCATEEFAVFLVQFLGGDEEQSQHRWWLGPRESHARFRIGHARWSEQRVLDDVMAAIAD